MIARQGVWRFLAVSDTDCPLVNEVLHDFGSDWYRVAYVGRQPHPAPRPGLVSVGGDPRDAHLITGSAVIKELLRDEDRPVDILLIGVLERIAVLDHARTFVQTVMDWVSPTTRTRDGAPDGSGFLVEVILAASVLTGPGFVVDFGELAPLKDYLDRTFDHRDLDDVLGTGLAGNVQVALHLEAWCRANLPTAVAGRLERVMVRCGRPAGPGPHDLTFSAQHRLAGLLGPDGSHSLVEFANALCVRRVHRQPAVGRVQASGCCSQTDTAAWCSAKAAWARLAAGRRRKRWNAASAVSPWPMTRIRCPGWRSRMRMRAVVALQVGAPGFAAGCEWPVGFEGGDGSEGGDGVGPGAAVGLTGILFPQVFADSDWHAEHAADDGGAFGGAPEG